MYRIRNSFVRGAVCRIINGLSIGLAAIASSSRAIPRRANRRVRGSVVVIGNKGIIIMVIYSAGELPSMGSRCSR